MVDSKAMQSGRYKAYPKYKDSGVEVLGSIPSYWRLTKLAYCFEKTNAGEVIDKSYWGSGREVLYTCNRTALASDYKKFPSIKRTTKNDLLLTRNGTPYVHKPIVNSIYSNVVQRITLKNSFDRDYLAFCLSNSALSLKGYGVSIESLNFENWKSIEFALPPINEQKIIANFLDYETAKIDTLIEKQQRLIELLTEKRQAVISHAVTKGLNPDVPMKDSGVEWLGEVPEHWDLVPLKYLCRFSGGGTPTKDNLSYWTNGTIPWVSPKDMKSFWISKTQDYITETAVKESSTNLVEAGTLLMVVRSGILQRTIPIAINTVPVTLNQDMKALRFNSRISTEYVANYILGNVQQLLLEWSKEGATVESIEHEYLSNSLVPIPPKNEQNLIVDSINKQMQVFSDLSAKAQRAIQLMQERRTALISAAVTGKIDVRDWVKPE